MADEYRKLAEKILDIFEIEYKDDEEFEELINKVKNVHSVYSSKTGRKISALTNEIGEVLEEKENKEEIKNLLDKVKEQHNRLKWE